MSRYVRKPLSINSFADLIGGDEYEINNVPLTDLHSFKNHPFKVIDDDKMSELVESIKKSGVLTPGIVRADIDGGYEIISGHRRKRACELAGLTEMPVVIKHLNDDEAVYVCRSRKILLRSLGDVQDPDETEDGQKRQDNRSMAR